MSEPIRLIAAATSSGDSISKAVDTWFDLRLADWAAFAIVVGMTGLLIYRVGQRLKPGELFYESKKARIFYAALLTPTIALLLVAIVVLGRVAIFGK